jgi:hypothetical protein
MPCWKVIGSREGNFTPGNTLADAKCALLLAMIANITSFCLRCIGHNGKLNLTDLLMCSLELTVKLVLKTFIKTRKN